MKLWVPVLLVALFLCSGLALAASSSNCTLSYDLTGAIGPATLDFFNRAEARAKDHRCDSLLIVMDTPGGGLETTHHLVSAILNSPIPVLCLVGPSGAHAGSAGAIILQACHVNGAMPATNIGASTPIMGTGTNIPKDLRRKIINDSKSWLDGLTKLRGRNQQFGEDIIVKAKSVSADEALKIGAVDTVAPSIGEFLKFAQGRKVTMTDSHEAQVKVGPVVTFNQDLRFKLLDILTDPQFAYLLFMGSLALIYFEVTHPSTMVAGVVGGMGLVISLIAFHKLNVEWGGLALMLLGIGFLIAEAFLPTFGILGAGGIVSFFIGSLFLFDPATTGYRLPLSLILPAVIIFGGAMLTLAFVVMRTRRVKRTTGFDGLIGETGVVSTLDDKKPGTGQMQIAGEIWRFSAPAQVAIGDKVRVVSHKGFTLNVEKAKEQ